MKILMRTTLYILLTMLLMAGIGASAQQKKIIKKTVIKGFVPTEAKNLVSDESEIHRFFDRKGNLLEERRKRISPYTNQLSSYQKKNFYGDDLLIDSTLIYNNDKYSLKLEYSNDTLGRVSEIREVGTEGKVNFRTVLFYDARGNKIKEKMFDKDSALFNFKDFVYDKNKNLIDESGTEQGTKRYHWISKYNKQNLIIERKDKSGTDELLRKHMYEYDKEWQLITEKVFDAAGNLQQVLKYEYEYY